MSTNHIITAALAAALALPAAAQDQGSIGDRARRAAGQPATQPAPAPGQAQAGAPADWVAFGEVHALNDLAARAGDLAASRGASQEVKDLGRTLADDHRRLDAQLQALLKPRDKDVNTLPKPDRQTLEGELSQLQSKSGEEFDRDFVAFLTRNGVAFVDTLKRARDIVAGKDHELKKFLDDAENSEEAHLASARQLKSQRQARTPPAR
jgi:putative membrane protein